MNSKIDDFSNNLCLTGLYCHLLKLINYELIHDLILNLFFN